MTGLESWHVAVGAFGITSWLYLWVIRPLVERTRKNELDLAVVTARLEHGDDRFEKLEAMIQENNDLIRAHEAGCHAWREQVLQRLPPQGT